MDQMVSMQLITGLQQQLSKSNILTRQGLVKLVITIGVLGAKDVIEQLLKIYASLKTNISVWFDKYFVQPWRLYVHSKRARS
jgi:transcriptional regulatory protein LevR